MTRTSRVDDPPRGARGRERIAAGTTSVVHPASVRVCTTHSHGVADTVDVPPTPIGTGG
jgi:hypothetical protein